MRTPLAYPVLAALLSLSTAAAAQPRLPPRPGAPLVPPAPPTTAALVVLPPPPTLEVDDPMLAPVPQAAKVLTSWKEALGFIVSRSTDLGTALQEVERAEGNARIALAAALPSLDGSVTVTGLPLPAKAAVTSPNPVVTASITAAQPILAPRAWYGIKTAELGVASSKYSVEDKERTIFAGVASAIITVLTAERTADINRNGLKSALQVVGLTERQFHLGTATRLDVLRAQQNAETARATLLSGDEALRQGREALGLALGFPEAYGVPGTLSLDEIEGTVRGVCRPGPLEERADIAKAHNDVEVAKRGVTDVWLQFAPTAVLQGTASVSNVAQTAGTLDSGRAAWNVQGVLSVPLWDGGVRYGNLRIARAAHEEAKLALEAQLRAASVQVDQALRSVSVAERERAVSERARDLARDLAKLTMSAYQLGTATSFDLVNTEQVWRAAELDLAVKDFALIQAKLAAVLATSKCSY